MEPCQQYVLDEMSFHKEYNTSQISSTVTDNLNSHIERIKTDEALAV